MPVRVSRWWLSLLRPCLALLLVPLARGASDAQKQDAEQRAIESIRHEALRNPSDRDGWRLPLAASWNVGERSTGFEPAWQVSEIQRGQYLLPWFGLSIPPPPGGTGTLTSYPATTDTLHYYESAVRYLARHHLPLSFETTQWERMLPEVSAEYARQAAEGVLPPLSPFDPVEPWYAVGRAWAQHATLRRIEELYPDPPLVLFISNNEQRKMTADELHAGYGASARADPQVLARRRAIGDAWIERYRAMERGFREGLAAPLWRARAVFVGYDAFVTPALGRWDGWLAYSLYVPGRIEPWPFAWDGASVSFYLHDWTPDADYIVWSPQIEAMNWVPALAAVRGSKPDFWFEISVWDGQQPDKPSDKLRFFSEREQEFTPARYGGMVQFGMWLLRPRVVREYRDVEHDRIRFGKYFDAVLAAVARVHEDPVLRAFWRSGRLLPNPKGGHPYAAAVPTEMATRARWFLLDTPANPPRPWQLDTPLKVYALALERGRKPEREWLVYAFSPRDAAGSVEVKIPQGPRTRVTAAVEGAFTTIRESDGVTQSAGTLRPVRPD